MIGLLRRSDLEAQGKRNPDGMREEIQRIHDEGQSVGLILHDVVTGNHPLEKLLERRGTSFD